MIKDKYYCILLHDEDINEDYPKVKVESVKEEKHLLMKLIALIREDRPDILSGWNLGHTLPGKDSFDIPYIINRGKRIIGDMINQISPLGIVEERYNAPFSYIIAGIEVIDYMQLYIKYSQNDRPSYSLDAICKDELGFGKIEYTGSLSNLYKTDIQKFIQYIINDVFLINKLEDRLEFMDLVVTIASFCHVRYEDIWHQTRIIDGLLLTYLKITWLISGNKLKKESND